MAKKRFSPFYFLGLAAALALAWYGIDFRMYLLGLVGVAILAVGLYWLYRQFAFMFRTRKAYGKVVEWTCDSENYHYAHVAFTAADGSEHRVRGSMGVSGKAPTAVGQVYPVRYNPGNPREARLDSVSQYWVPPVFVTLMGGFVLFMACFGKPVHRHAYHHYAAPASNGQW